MGLRQIFWTTIYSWDGVLSADVVTIPRSDVYDPTAFESLDSLLRALDLKGIAALSPDDFEARLAGLLSAVEMGPGRVEAWRHAAETGRLGDWRAAPHHSSFSSELLSSSRVPFEESPLTSKSLAALTTFGATLGLALAGPTPVAFIYVPAGIVLVVVSAGIAVGLAEGFQGGLRSQVRRFLIGRR
jgi:hypothetical protein